MKTVEIEVAGTTGRWVGRGRFIHDKYGPKYTPYVTPEQSQDECILDVTRWALDQGAAVSDLKIVRTD